MLVIKVESELMSKGPGLALDNSCALGTPYSYGGKSYTVITQYPAPGGRYFLLVESDAVVQLEG